VHAGVKEGYPIKKLFTAIGSCSVKMIADRYIHAGNELFGFINIDDLELPKRGFW